MDRPALARYPHLERRLTMASYTLTRFTGLGEAELVRLIFAQAGAKYEDIGITPEQWPELKPSTPFGSLPILDDDVTVLSGSTAIARYLAEKYRLAGATCLQNAEICSIVDATLDVWRCISSADTDEAKDNIDKQISDALGNFERMAATNGHAEGWIYGEKVTYADFAVYNLMDHAAGRGVDLSGDRYPTLLRLRASVAALPNIAKWLSTRPESAL